MTIEEFKSTWVGRIFMDEDTGVVFRIPSTVYKGAFYSIGNGFVDVGDGYYCRFGGNIIEVGKDE